MSIKTKIKSMAIVKDFLSFCGIYHEVSNKWKFLYYRLFPSKLGRRYWPIHKSSKARGRIFIGRGARVGHRPNCIIQGRDRLFIGDHVEIGSNCVIISGNHSLTNQREVVRKETIIGNHCWIASSCNILAGVVLGPRTIIGAGSVVTKSFPEGYCVIAGNPAKVIKTIEPDSFVKESSKVEYYGYIREDKFQSYYKQHLSKFKFDYDLSKVTDNEFVINNMINK